MYRSNKRGPSPEALKAGNSSAQAHSGRVCGVVITTTAHATSKLGTEVANGLRHVWFEVYWHMNVYGFGFGVSVVWVLKVLR